MDPGDLPTNAIESKALDKVYTATKGQPPKHALKSVDLAVPRGSMFGLLGPNGAGKSTFINILAGLVTKTSGKAYVWGMDIDECPRETRAAIGVVPQELSTDPFFNPREILEVQAGLYGVPPRERRTEDILRAVGLSSRADSYTRSLSGGMRRRLLVAKSMVHAPPVLVLDEPTAGVDIELRQQIWDYMRALNQKGTTIVLTTHYLDEAEALCERIAIIHHGKVIACEPTEMLVRRLDRKTLRLTLAEELIEVPLSMAPFEAQLVGPNQLLVSYHTSQTDIGLILAAISNARLTVKDLSTEEPDLTDVFIELTSTRANSAVKPQES